MSSSRVLRTGPMMRGKCDENTAKMRLKPPSTGIRYTMSARVRPVGGRASTTLSILTASTGRSAFTRSPVNGDISGLAGLWTGTGTGEGVGVGEAIALTGLGLFAQKAIPVTMTAMTATAANTVITIVRGRNAMVAPLNHPSITRLSTHAARERHQQPRAAVSIVSPCGGAYRQIRQCLVPQLEPA